MLTWGQPPSQWQKRQGEFVLCYFYWIISATAPTHSHSSHSSNIDTSNGGTVHIEWYRRGTLHTAIMMLSHCHNKKGKVSWQQSYNIALLWLYFDYLLFIYFHLTLSSPSLTTSTAGAVGYYNAGPSDSDKTTIFHFGNSGLHKYQRWAMALHGYFYFDQFYSNSLPSNTTILFSIKF